MPELEELLRHKQLNEHGLFSMPRLVWEGRPVMEPLIYLGKCDPHASYTMVAPPTNLVVSVPRSTSRQKPRKPVVFLPPFGTRAACVGFLQ